MPNPQSFDFLSYRLVSRCPMCNAPAADAKLEMLDENTDGSLLIFSRCQRCNIGLLAYLTNMQPGNGMYGAAILTELGKNELSKFARSQPISADEVMDYVKWLNKSKK